MCDSGNSEFDTPVQIREFGIIACHMMLVMSVGVVVRGVYSAIYIAVLTSGEACLAGRPCRRRLAVGVGVWV